ncbi:MAG: thioredoxin fold domain-containing protein [candidate division Zixibacteria bacterium]|nr:thioredoxin fold domain-containing protein [candidate division Zixibacteria bacterium]
MGIFDKIFNRPPKPGKPLPVTDDSFELEVLKSSVPVVVDFWSSKCPPCQVMGGLLNELGPQFAGKVKILKLRVEENPVVTAQFQIMSVPTIIFFRNGKMVDRVTGLIPLRPLKEKLEQLSR